MVGQTCDRKQTAKHWIGVDIGGTYMNAEFIGLETELVPSRLEAVTSWTPWRET